MRSFLLPMVAPNSVRGGAILGAAVLRAAALIARARPRVTFATGGYVSVPGTLASRLFRVPVVLFLPDVLPGKAIARLAPLTRTIAVTTEESRRHLPADKVVVTGYPVREEFLSATRAGGRARFGIPDDAPVLVVTGGSLGARSLNSALVPCLSWLLKVAHVIHITGTDRYPEVASLVEPLPAEVRERYHLVPYLDAADMASALAAADLCLCRCGASALGELPATGTPAVVVPLPLSGAIQRANADYLVAAGAAVMLDDDALDTSLAPVLEMLLSDRERLDSMTVAARHLARPDAAQAIAGLVLEAAR